MLRAYPQANARQPFRDKQSIGIFPATSNQAADRQSDDPYFKKSIFSVRTYAPALSV